jgi:hypothetical protein
MVLSPDQRLKNLDERCLDIVAEQFKKHINLIGIHLRDARNLLLAVKEDDRILAKGAIVLASAALEANLEYFCQLAIEIRNLYKPNLYLPPELYYLKGVEAFIDEKGELRERPQRQRLEERLVIVPKLLGKAFNRDYQPSKSRSAAFKKLRNTIERRDAIIHPRWDRYLQEMGWFEAAEANRRSGQSLPLSRNPRPRCRDHRAWSRRPYRQAGQKISGCGQIPVPPGFGSARDL